jgi:hypothetical protein
VKHSNLRDLPVSELVERFADMGVRQDKALLEDEIAKFNRLFDQMESVKAELKSRTGDQRRALLTLFNHPNMQVRLKAAKATLALAPVEARQMLKAISESGWQPQAGDAGMCLWNLARGVFVPD